MKAVIMAGGRGTRMASVARDIPKPMLPLGGKPILLREIEVLAREGFTDVILVIGHLGDAIRSYFGDGAAFGVHITYVEEALPLGTAGALALLKDELADDDFLLLNGDLLFDVDLGRFLAFHRERGGICTILTHPSTHPNDSVTVKLDGTDRVTAFLPPSEARGPARNCTNAGLHFCSPRILSRFAEAKRTDLDREVLLPLAAEGALFAYRSPEYVKDVGTPERLADATRELAAGLVEKCSMRSPRAAVFLDRDGTINRPVPFLSHPDQMELLDGAAAAIKALNARGIPVFVVTNQPVVARGDVSEAELDAIHGRMEELLAAKGAFVNDVFYCPHHPHSGFAGEVRALKIPCQCRKPAPGMLLAAAKRYHIALDRSYMIGDRESDIEAGRRAHCRTAAIGAGLLADVCGTDLLSCVQKILENEENPL